MSHDQVGADRSTPLQVAVTGSTGLIGAALTRSLRTTGHQVVPLVRGQAGVGQEAIGWDPTAGTLDASSLDRFDAAKYLARGDVRAWVANFDKDLAERVYELEDEVPENPKLALKKLGWLLDSTLPLVIGD